MHRDDAVLRELGRLIEESARGCCGNDDESSTKLLRLHAYGLGLIDALSVISGDRRAAYALAAVLDGELLKLDPSWDLVQQARTQVASTTPRAARC